MNSAINVRKSEERGKTNIGWLDSRHSFSFGNYHDPEHMGYRSLRVINEDKVEPGQGFGTHPHRSMEILSYVVEGSLEHKDSMGNGRVIRAGEFQYMSAGDGVMHSEFNPSPDEKVHFLQIWIQPREKGGEPRYRDFDTASRRQTNGLALLASPDGAQDSAEIRQDAQIYFGHLEPGKSILVPGGSPYPYAWLQLIRGRVEISGETVLDAGDGACTELPDFTVTAADAESEFILFRLS